ncbi:MAG: hypothetical protein RRY05_09660 [Bacteroidales bacterium]
MYKLLLSIILLPFSVILFTSCGVQRKLHTIENKDLIIQEKDSTAVSVKNNITTDRLIGITDNSTIEITEFYPTGDSLKSADSIPKQEVKRKILIKKNIKQVDSSKIKHEIIKDSIDIKQENTIDKGKIIIKEKIGHSVAFRNTILIIIAAGIIFMCYRLNKKYFN